MKAKELRIGNWIKYQDYNLQIVAIDAIDSDDENVTIWTDLLGEYHVLIHNGKEQIIKPIPLTEEWFESYGFVKWEAKVNMGIGGQPMKGWKLNRFVLNNSFEGLTFEKSIYLGNIIVENVHQLQNLYFCICGKELTLKQQP